VRVNSKSGFTLAEIMVTILIVGIGLLMIVQGLSTAKVKALQTYNIKAARDLGMLTMGRIRAGLYQEELDSRLSGNYAEEGFEYFAFDVLLGDEQFDNDYGSGTESPFHDSWAAREEREEEARRDSDSDEDEDEDEIEEDYEKVRIKVSFPPVPEYKNYVILEEWIPWKQVYGDDEEEDGDVTEESGT
jgi:prepilin-type N-terminal cleavage/methylation domain-containing protein